MSAPQTLAELTRVLAHREPHEREAVIGRVPPQEVPLYDRDFLSWAHPGQEPPEGDWRVWMMLAGRGFGKTRAGAEWVTSLATRLGAPVRIALVGATIADVRQVMIEGESGLLAVAPKNRPPSWEPSIGQLRWQGGSIASVYSGENPEKLRGPEHHFAWCDELAKWAYPDATWDNLQMTLRLGEMPRALITTTPRPIGLIRKLDGAPGVKTTRGRTVDNANLPGAFIAAMTETYGGTRLGRQELDGELIEDAEGSLWPRALIERCRAPGAFAVDEGNFVRVVIGVDPPASAGGDACGIVAVGLAKDGQGYVLGDHSVRGLSPDGWARAVAEAAELHGADRVIAEANNGGQMVESVLRAVKAGLPITLVHASRGKVARAEPVAALFEKKRAWFAGAFPELEDELAGLTAGGGYEGPGRSPDRADAMVWAMTELMLGKGVVEPRVRWV
ncbi:DNA-packaging protein [Allosphingosinicella vermicomposti]|uniref:DNA-packaging protein n=1 Tax=Allosphingosinicella vermicomposti TaxID=614671 RepID=UPI000D0F8830|nr:terminase family protein [Allosphingosinicella vermicomposti]